MTAVKICGITTPDAMTAAIEGGAAFVGLVFYPASPRYAAPELAAYLAGYVPKAVQKVGLFVDPDDAALERVLHQVPLDMIQLHGKETPERTLYIREHFRLPVMKALPVAAAEDLAAVPAYADAADWLLFDAKAPPGAVLPGGNGLPFDWALLQDFRSKTPWMLAGGLTPGNVAVALSRLNPDAVDVSSGVETAPGVKAPEKIAEFLRSVKKA